MPCVAETSNAPEGALKMYHWSYLLCSVAVFTTSFKNNKFPHFTSTIDNQQDATILIYLLLIRSTCFGRCFRPSSGAYQYNYSFWYCPPMLLLAGVAYTQHQPAATSVVSCSYSDMLHPSLQHRWTIPEAVVTVICSWWWAKASPETCRAD